MNIWLYRKMIYRHDKPNDRELDHHIIKMERKFVGQLQVENNSNVPHVGDVYYIDKIPYEIKRRIFVPDETGLKINDCVCEVVIYSPTYTTSYGSDSWRETIPLVTELPDEIVEAPKEAETDGEEEESVVS